jgi:hypothetical protein
LCVEEAVKFNVRNLLPADDEFTLKTENIRLTLSHPRARDEVGTRPGGSIGTIGPSSI